MASNVIYSDTKSKTFPNVVNIVFHLMKLSFFSFVITTAALPFIIMNIVFKPYERGIYCDDESIMYPVKPDTITHGMLAAVTISCTVIIVSFISLFPENLLGITSVKPNSSLLHFALLTTTCCLLHY